MNQPGMLRATHFKSIYAIALFILMLALHKNDKADAYADFLFNDYAQVREIVQQSMSALRFMK